MENNRLTASFLFNEADTWKPNRFTTGKMYIFFSFFPPVITTRHAEAKSKGLASVQSQKHHYADFLLLMTMIPAQVRVDGKANQVYHNKSTDRSVTIAFKTRWCYLQHG